MSDAHRCPEFTGLEMSSGVNPEGEPFVHMVGTFVDGTSKTIAQLLDRREEWLRRRDGHRNPDDGGYYSCAAVREYSIDGELTGSDAYCDCGYVAQREGELRLIEAHREIVALHSPQEHFGPSACGVCYDLNTVGNWPESQGPADHPCPTLRALVRGYGLTLEEGT